MWHQREEFGFVGGEVGAVSPHVAHDLDDDIVSGWPVLEELDEVLILRRLGCIGTRLAGAGGFGFGRFLDRLGDCQRFDHPFVGLDRCALGVGDMVQHDCDLAGCFSGEVRSSEVDAGPLG